MNVTVTNPIIPGYKPVESLEQGAEVIAKCYDALFSYCIMDDYYITPVYEGVQSPENDGKLITLTHLDYTRNRWTDEGCVVNIDGKTDLLYADFEIAFTDYGKQIYGDGTGYTAGVVYELCGQLREGDSFYESYQNYASCTSDELAQAVGLESERYTFVDESETTISRSLMYSRIPTANLTNKNRIEYGKVFANVYSEKNGRYTNSTYVMKAYAYLKDSEGNVTLSDPVYVCLNGVANMDLAKDYEDNSRNND